MTGLRSEIGPLSSEVAAILDLESSERSTLLRGWRKQRIKTAAEALSGRVIRVAGCVGNRTVTVSDIRVDTRDILSCTITHGDLPVAYPDGTPINPFQFMNPPLAIRDGPSLSLGYIDPLTGQPAVAASVREAPVEALRQMVRDAVAAAFSALN